MRNFLKIIGLSLIWFSVWAFLMLYLEPQGIDYISRYILTSIYFLLIIVALTTIFKKEIDGYADDFTMRDLLVMVFFFISVISIYYCVNILSEGSQLNLIKNSLPPMLQLDYRFLVSKAFDIMFQQTFYMISIYYLFNNDVSKSIDMILFGLYVMLLHLPLLFIFSPAGKIIFSVSFFAGLIFSYFITKSKKGFIYSYMFHVSFYVIFATIFWLGGAKYFMGLL